MLESLLRIQSRTNPPPHNSRHQAFKFLEIADVTLLEKMGNQTSRTRTTTTTPVPPSSPYWAKAMAKCLVVKTTNTTNISLLDDSVREEISSMHESHTDDIFFQSVWDGEATDVVVDDDDDDDDDDMEPCSNHSRLSDIEEEAFCPTTPKHIKRRLVEASLRQLVHSPLRVIENDKEDESKAIKTNSPKPVEVESLVKTESVNPETVESIQKVPSNEEASPQDTTEETNTSKATMTNKTKSSPQTVVLRPATLRKEAPTLTSAAAAVAPEFQTTILSPAGPRPPINTSWTKPSWISKVPKATTNGPCIQTTTTTTNTSNALTASFEVPPLQKTTTTLTPKDIIAWERPSWTRATLKPTTFIKSSTTTTKEESSSLTKFHLKPTPPPPVAKDVSWIQPSWTKTTILRKTQQRHQQ